MQVIIDIPEDEYNIIKKSNAPMTWVEHLIKNGTPLSKGATNGDIIKTMFPNAEISYGLNGIVGVKFIHMTVFDSDWWNVPYIKADKVERVSDK